MKKIAVLLLFGGIALITGASVSVAQSEGPAPIRVETHEVVVPIFVVDKSDIRGPFTNMYGDEAYQENDKAITGLAAKDFHVFEDGKEQRIENFAVEPPRRWDVSDNVSYHLESSCTSKGIWSSADLAQTHLGISAGSSNLYRISYVPPSAPAGSCHRIKVKVDRKHATVYARDEYCDSEFAPYDPLYGTKLGKQIQAYADSDKAGKFPVSVQADSFFGTSGANRANVTVEFPSSVVKREWNGVNLDATVAVVGTIYAKDRSLAARFSDSACVISWVGMSYIGEVPRPSVFLGEWELWFIPSRYETQVDLPPGNYDLKLVITDGEKFGRVDVPLNVDGLDRDGPSISDIALCKRYHKVPDGPRGETQAPRYVPLVSNGLEFTPAGDTRFTKSDRLMTYFEIKEPLLMGAEAVNVQFQMKVSDAKTGELKTDTGLRPAQGAILSGNPVIPLAEEIAIDKLPPGSYRLEVQASDSAGKSTAWRATYFTVE